jgi:hypothetical protein
MLCGEREITVHMPLRYPVFSSGRGTFSPVVLGECRADGDGTLPLEPLLCRLPGAVCTPGVRYSLV